jgi:hypothetical protein
VLLREARVPADVGDQEGADRCVLGGQNSSESRGRVSIPQRGRPPARDQAGNRYVVVNIDSLNVKPTGADAPANTGLTPPLVNELEM